MDDEVDRMITRYIIFAKIPVEGKCGPNNWPAKTITGSWVSKKGFKDGINREISDVQTRIFNYIRIIVKMPGGLKRV